MVKCGVLFEVRTGFLNNIQTSFDFKGLIRILQYRIIWIGFMLKCVTWLHVYLHNNAINSWYDTKFGEFVQGNYVAYMIGIHIELAFRWDV
jgi:hypothetical protein